MFLTIAITGNQDSTPTTIQLGIVKTEVEGLQLMNTTLAINIILTLVIMFVGFFVTKYIMTKKLNLQ
jgi:ABC-type glycerol-3-phosphate transport system permease component